MFTIIGVDGKEYGPVTADQIRQWITENRLTPAMQARREGETEWRRIADFAEFAPPAPPVGADGMPPLDPAATVAPGAALPAAPAEPQPVVFTGEWTEYFKIWIVNVLLTIVTLGIYAAWAKVRKRRYFCANTRVLGHTFEYLADPVKILYGNLIVGAIFLALALSQMMPLLYLCLLLLFSIAAPWFIVRALAFNARNTAWRGLRFNFTGKYGGSAMVFLLWPLMVPFTMGLLMPVVAQKQKDFVVKHHTFGRTAFGFRGTVEAFFKVYGVTLLFFLPVIAAYFGFIAFMIKLAIETQKGGGGARPPSTDSLALFGIAMLFVVVPATFIGIQYFRARMFNLLWNNSSLAGTRFLASMRFRDLLLVEFTNKLVVALTLGFLFPWAAIRTAKLRADSLKIVPFGNPDDFIAAEQSAVGAVGDSANDFFDFDIGFGA
ncbi:MAG: DUF898 family protein [Opitutaceae bacterium]|nr:DUF898 family protein [Opitutaceae bacterium]